MCRSLSKLLMALVITWAVLPAHSQSNSWQRIHPDGPDNAMGGAVAFATVGNGSGSFIMSRFQRLYFRPSKDQAWEYIVPTLNGEPITLSKMLFHPSEPNYILAGTYYRGLVESNDNGKTWQPVYDEIDISLLGMAPSDPDVVFARSWITSQIGVSDDRGKSWAFKTPINMESLRNLVIDPINPDVVYALDGQAIKKSVDSGALWVQQDEGTGSQWYMNDLAIDPSDGQNLYAASGQFSYIFKTADAAQSWEFTGLSIDLGTGSMNAVVVDPSNSNSIYAGAAGGGAYRSQDGTNSWERLSADTYFGSWYDLSVATNGDVLFGGDSGAAIPTLTGELELSNQGYSDFQVSELRFAPGNADYLYVRSLFSGFGVKLADQQNWALRNGAFRTDVRDLSVSHQDPNHVLVAEAAGGLYESFDAGATWQQTPSPASGFGLTSIEIAPSGSNVRYAMTQTGLHRSIDSGNSWTLILDRAVTGMIDQKVPLTVSHENADVVSLGTRTNGVFTTFNGGETWINSIDMFQNGIVRAISSDPRDVNTLYIALEGGYVWRSQNLGMDWQDITGNSPLGPYPSSIEADKFVEGRLLLNASGDIYIFEPHLNLWKFYPRPPNTVCDYIGCQSVFHPEHQGRILTSSAGELYALDRDSDFDSINDDVDNCSFVANVAQRDTDNDSYGNYCDPDLNNDLVVNFLDIEAFAAVFATSNELADFDGDGSVNFIDFSILRDYFLRSPGPGAMGDLPVDSL